MDTALILKKKVRQGEKLSDQQIDSLLRESQIIESLLLADYQIDKFTGLRKLEFLLLELSEIPYTIRLEKTKTMLTDLIKGTKQVEGFSLSNGENGILACHQAMMTLIMIRFEEKELAEHGLNWIMRYQITKKGEVCHWHGCDLYQRFGCVGKTPCYDGLAKSMKALSEFQFRYGQEERIQQKLSEGIAYILEHEVYKTMDRSVTLGGDITKLFYPYPYRTNLIELLTLLKSEKVLSDIRTTDAKAIILNKQNSDGSFNPEKTFMKTSWVVFDEMKKSGEWISDEIEQLFI
ncbi:hypothetical protein [uncultured Vagococcus sp.]|uniref:hypothetical protein n=1 Tax=uncultured Vagococcus sp. TaxID=189676 RepID=UPI0028D339E7|nr:hypothetical protein [uncultured Vagococcus sp.]